jgi:hypothetical protein
MKHSPILTIRLFDVLTFGHAAVPRPLVPRIPVPVQPFLIPRSLNPSFPCSLDPSPPRSLDPAYGMVYVRYTAERRAGRALACLRRGLNRRCVRASHNRKGGGRGERKNNGTNPIIRRGAIENAVCVTKTNPKRSQSNPSKAAVPTRSDARPRTRRRAPPAFFFIDRTPWFRYTGLRWWNSEAAPVLSTLHCRFILQLSVTFPLISVSLFVPTPTRRSRGLPLFVAVQVRNRPRPLASCVVWRKAARLAAAR